MSLLPHGGRPQPLEGNFKADFLGGSCFPLSRAEHRRGGQIKARGLLERSEFPRAPTDTTTRGVERDTDGFFWLPFLSRKRIRKRPSLKNTPDRQNLSRSLTRGGGLRSELNHAHHHIIRPGAPRPPAIYLSLRRARMRQMPKAMTALMPPCSRFGTISARAAAGSVTPKKGIRRARRG